MMSEITNPNLPADLPEDFKWGDVIPPNGEDIGQPKQRGYNYLTQQLNAVQTALNRLTEEFAAEMSNKAKGNAKTGDALNSEKVLGTDKIMTLDSTGYVDIPENADLNNDKYKQFGAYACPLTVRARTLLNCPTQVAFRMHVIPGTGIGSAYPMQIISPMDAGIEFRRTWLNDGKVWGSWRETAQIEYGTWEFKIMNGDGTRQAVFESQNANYIKVGNIMFLRCGFKLKSKGTLVDNENIYIAGAPPGHVAYSSASISWWMNGKFPNGLSGELSGSRINLYKPAANGVANAQAADIADNFTVEDLTGWKLV